MISVCLVHNKSGKVTEKKATVHAGSGNIVVDNQEYKLRSLFRVHGNNLALHEHIKYGNVKMMNSKSIFGNFLPAPFNNSLFFGKIIVAKSSEGSYENLSSKDFIDIIDMQKNHPMTNQTVLEDDSGQSYESDDEDNVDEDHESVEESDHDESGGSESEDDL